ncbi:MAG: SpoIID/LytB domain-containing protein [bacterium]
MDDRHVPYILLLLLLWAIPAQSQELSSSDRLALLYAPQLNFTRDGDPIIRVGIVEGRNSVKFTTDRAFRVLPADEGGPEFRFAAGRSCEVRATDSKPGTYRHLVVVNRLPIAERNTLEKLKQTWLQRGYVPEMLEVGGLFAVRGKVFDSRTTLVTVHSTKNRAEAEKLKRKLEAEFGIEATLHSEISTFPSNTITLTCDGSDASVVTRDALWIAPMQGEEYKIRYTIPQVEKSYGSGFETRQFTGSLIFAPDNAGKLVAMTSVGAEKLLKGVVPAEMFASAHEEALKAQAVAARNEIFASIGVRNLAEPYMLRSDVMDQVYAGIGAEDARTSKAVDATRGIVMFYGKKIIEAVYSSNAGGFTENNENVWDMEPRPWLRGKPDALEKVPARFADGISDAEVSDFLKNAYDSPSKSAPVSSNKLFRWSKTVTIDAANKWLTENGRKVGRIKDVRVLSRGISGRVKQLEIVGDQGKTIVERELNARRLFGGLRSGLFTMQMDKDSKGYVSSFVFEGAGFGHGVGMCQTGAIGLATRGSTFRDILSHYYEGITIERLYE